MYIKTSQEFRLSYKVCCMYWCFFYRKEKRSSSTRIKAKKTYWQKNYSKSSSGVLFSAPLSLGLFLWIKRDSFNFKWKSLVAQPIILKLSISPTQFWQLIWFRTAELFLLLGLKVNFWCVLKDIPRCSKARTRKCRLVLPMYIALQLLHVYLYNKWERTLVGILSLNLKKHFTLSWHLKITLILHWGKYLCTNFCIFDLSSSDCLPKKGKQMLNSFWGTVTRTYTESNISIDERTELRGSTEEA